MHFFRFAAFAAGFVVPSAALAITTYSSGTLDFQTQSRQSAWGPGAAQRIAPAPTFIGPAPWNTSLTIGDIVGGVSSSSLPNPRHIAWSACRLIPFASCGSEPSRTLRVKLDTRTGAEAVLATSGRIGLEARYELDAGSVAAQLAFEADADLPSGPLPLTGGFVDLNPTATFASGSLDSISPTARAAVDFVASGTFSATVEGCLIGAGCKDASLSPVSFQTRNELISIDPTGVTYLDGFLPDFVSLETPLADYTISLEADLVTKKLDFNAQANSTGVTEPTKTVDGNSPGSSGIVTEVANFRVQAPQLDLQGDKAAGEDSIAVSGQSAFLAANADLDGLLAYANVIPPLGVRVDLLNALSGAIDIVDAEAGPKIDVFQEFRLTPKLMVDLVLDREVEFQGLGLLDRYTGLWEDIPAFTLLDDTLFKPTFWVDAQLESRTGLQIGAEFSLEALSGSLALGYGGINFFEAKVGPFVDEDFAFDPDFLRFAIFDETFSLGGFDPIAGETFALSLASPVARVPLPASVWLLLAGLGALRFRARRRSAAA